MILIADSGSTKITWRLVDPSGKTRQFETEGYNPCYTGGERLFEILKPNLPEGFFATDVKEVAFYGAGVYDNKYDVICDAIQPIFPNAKIIFLLKKTSFFFCRSHKKRRFLASFSIIYRTVEYDKTPYDRI